VEVGLIGYGSIAREHARAIAALRTTAEGREIQITGVMGRLREPAEAFAREIGIGRATTALDDLLANSGIEAVIVCSPTDQHAAQTEQALRAGKHVLCEIPLATSLADTDRLIALAVAADRRLMVCQTQRYHPALVEARRMVGAGELHPRSIICRYGFPPRENVNWMGRRRSWTDNLLWHHGCHAVDAALWLLGATEVDVAAQVAKPGGALDIPMDLGIVMRTRADQIATVALSYNTHIAIHDYLLIGEETSVLFADDRLRGADGALVSGTGDGVGDAIVRQDAEFFAAVREEREPAVSGRSVRPAMAALQVAQDALDARLGSLEGTEDESPKRPVIGSRRGAGRRGAKPG
jgi:2-hydroxy-4-carboxymuconate semialdehyde hemiacetal dehydrogenase